MEIIQSIKQIIPKLDYLSFKGDLGKLAVIGGSFEYTGAPYYSAMASIKGGGELTHIFCTVNAAIPIKSYSPECIVHPLLNTSEEQKSVWETQQNQNKIIQWLNSMTSLVIGSGLGRDLQQQILIPKLISSYKKFIILDADAFWYIQQDSELLNMIQQQSNQIILTPNRNEMERLCKLVDVKFQTQKEDEINLFNQNDNQNYYEININNKIAQTAVLVSKALNNVTIVQKGLIDVITNGQRAFIVKQKGSPKRSGGQGDILTGLIGTFCHWTSLNQISPLYGCVLASYITKKSAFYAYQKKSISVSSPDILDEIGFTLNEYFQQLENINLSQKL